MVSGSLAAGQRSIKFAEQISRRLRRPEIKPDKPGSIGLARCSVSATAATSRIYRTRSASSRRSARSPGRQDARPIESRPGPTAGWLAGAAVGEPTL